MASWRLSPALADIISLFNISTMQTVAVQPLIPDYSLNCLSNSVNVLIKAVIIFYS